MRHTLLLGCLATLALTSCGGESPTTGQPTGEPATTATPSAPPAPPPAAPVNPASAPAAEDPEAPFEMSTFAGAFTAGPARLELHGDGTYSLEGMEDSPSQGSWTHEAGSNVIRLDPGSKSAQDRVFRLSGRDVLTPLGPDAQPAGGQSPLRRQAAR